MGEVRVPGLASKSSAEEGAAAAGTEPRVTRFGHPSILLPHASNLGVTRHHLGRAVWRTVVDDDNFDLPVRLRQSTLNCVRQEVGLLVTRNYYRDEWRGRFSHDENKILCLDEYAIASTRSLAPLRFGRNAGAVSVFSWCERKRISQGRQASLIFAICFVSKFAGN